MSEWTVVYKGKKVRQNGKNKIGHLLRPALSKEDAVKQIRGKIEQLSTSTFYAKFRDLMVEHIFSFSSSKDKSISSQHIDIVCYGLGSFSRTQSALYQLCLILLFIKNLKENIAGLSISFEVYDPVFSSDEKNILTEFGATVLSENEEGKRRVRHKTLFYMPHCGRALYNNVLWANWGFETLKNVAVLGNSFQMYVDTAHRMATSKRSQKGFASVNVEQKDSRNDVSDSISCIRHLVNAVTETPCGQEQFEQIGVFNDLCLHSFSVDSLRTFSDAFWLRKPREFIADGTDPEIIPSSAGPS